MLNEYIVIMLSTFLEMISLNFRRNRQKFVAENGINCNHDKAINRKLKTWMV